MRPLAAVGAGVLVIAAIVLAVVLAPQSPSNASPSPAAISALPSASLTAPPSAPPVSSAPAPASSQPADLASLLHPLVASWQPAGPFLVVEHSDPRGTTVLAVALAGGATPLVTLAGLVQLGYDLRDDGSVMAAALMTTARTSRIAIWDLATGTTRWLTEDEPGVQHSTPVWSEDGAFVYYAAHMYSAQTNTSTDLGIFRIRSDGTGKTRVRAPEENGAQLRGVTPDGRGLVWDRIRAGGAVEVLDLVSGQNRSFDETTTATLLSWRRAQPRALVMVGGCCAGRPGGSLALWNDATGSSKILIGAASTPPIRVLSASWEPRGARFAAAIIESPTIDYFGTISIFDSDGRRLAALAGTDGTRQVLWLPMGIVFVRPRDTGGTEIMIVPESGGQPSRIFEDATSMFIRAVAGP
jgi:hypothetical protein